jgi:hypothetical protein
MELHRFAMQVKSEMEAQPHGSQKADSSSKICPQPVFIRLASTPKKELESQV